MSKTYRIEYTTGRGNVKATDALTSDDRWTYPKTAERSYWIDTDGRYPVLKVFIPAGWKHGGHYRQIGSHPRIIEV